VSFRVLLGGLAFAGVVGVEGLALADDLPTPPPTEVHATPLPENSLAVHSVLPYPTVAWLAAQLVPSPELAIGRQSRIDEAGGVDKTMSTAFGLRWQLTPFLWSWGVHRSQTRWRTVVVDPIARHSGSLELSTSFEYIFAHISQLIFRPGVRAYFPLVQRGEYLSASLGTSIYAYDGLRVAYDVGVYTYGGFLGFLMTVAPTHRPLAAIATINLRYF
jgi:hypothetical protein